MGIFSDFFLEGGTFKKKFSAREKGKRTKDDMVILWF